MPSLAHAFDAMSRAHPQRLAFADDYGSVTYGQLGEDARRIAGALYRSGVRRGDRVVLLLPSTLAFPKVFWALQYLGATPCALNPYTPAAAVVRRASSARPRLVVFDPATLPSFAEAAPELACIPLPALESEEGSSSPLLTATREELAWLQPTSGTSGEPRLAMIRQRNVLDLLAGMYVEQPADSDDVHVSWVPPWHDLGLVRFLITPLFIGTSCHIVPPAMHTIPKWLETITKVRGRVTAAPDFAYRIAAHLGGAQYDLTSLNYALTGGEPIRLTTVKQFEERFGIPGAVHTGYGLAEATLGVAFQRWGEAFVSDAGGHVSCGRAAPGLEVRVDAADGQPGEILVRGYSVFAGYFEAPEATEEVLRDGWLHTGDIGRFDEAGRLYVLGRRKAMLKRGGAVLAPRELEDAALTVPGVKLSAAVSLPPTEQRTTEGIALAIELLRESGEPHSLAAAVAAAVRESIGFAPERIVVLASRSIPITWNGKIRHDRLREELTSGELATRGAIVFDSAAG
jgi:fatty-acyl-CoA synthase